MKTTSCIRIWLPDDIPTPFQQLIPYHEDSGVIVMFVAHVPQEVLSGKRYHDFESNPYSGWIREGELGLFGSNALDTIRHPEGDGIILIGSCV